MYRNSHKLYSIEAIVLSRRNYGEADRIVTVFSKEFGKLRLMAKGIRRITSKRASHLEVFTRLSCLVHTGKTMDSISEAVSIESYPLIRGDLGRVSVAYLLCELVDTLLGEKQEHRDVYVLLSNAFVNISTTTGDDLYRVSREFAQKLLWALGFLPKGHVLEGKKLESFIEDITERTLKSAKLIRRLAA